MSSYVPNTPAERLEMLRTIGMKEFEELFASIPADLRLARPLAIADPLSESEAFEEMRRIAGSNSAGLPSFLGAGCYRHYIPSIVRHITSRSEFYTAYTPYQPEASQGALQAIFEYQTMICELTGMDASNASLYDGATAAAEAAVMCIDATGRHRIAIAGNAHPDTIEVLRTYCRAWSTDLDVLPFGTDGVLGADALRLIGAGTAGVIVQQPNYFGRLEDMQALCDAAHAAGALFVASADPISMGLIAPPGEIGADIAIGDGQPLGNAENFGGPGFGFIACREALQRKLPGRIVGQTADPEGTRAFVLTLQAREQHIRRAKASSNICSNQALNALAAAVYLTAMGPEGLRGVAELTLQKASYAAGRICDVPGMRLKYPGPSFREFVVASDLPPARINAALLEAGIIGGLDLGDGSILYCVTEMNSKAEIDRLVSVLEAIR